MIMNQSIYLQNLQKIFFTELPQEPKMANSRTEDIPKKQENANFSREIRFNDGLSQKLPRSSYENNMV